MDGGDGGCGLAVLWTSNSGGLLGQFARLCPVRLDGRNMQESDYGNQLNHRNVQESGPN